MTPKPLKIFIVVYQDMSATKNRVFEKLCNDTFSRIPCL